MAVRSKRTEIGVRSATFRVSCSPVPLGPSHSSDTGDCGLAGRLPAFVGESYLLCRRPEHEFAMHGVPQNLRNGAAVPAEVTDEHFFGGALAQARKFTY